MRSIKFLAPAVVAVTILCAPAAAGVSVVGGGAVGVVASGVVTVAPTPEVTLPSTGGGPFDATLASLNVPNLLSTGTLTVHTQGSLASGNVASSSLVQNVNVALGLGLTADAVQSTCGITTGGNPSGVTTITNGHLAALNLDLPTTMAPNFAISVAGVASVMLNEQIPDSTPGMNGMTVNAIHIQTLLGQDVVIAQSRCSTSGNPTAVALRSISASRTGHGVLLRWSTGSEAGTVGFNVYRQQGAKRVKLNGSLIVAGASLRGSSYSFLARHSVKGRLYVQSVGADGRRAWLASTAAS
jgi:hypothetical protein